MRRGLVVALGVAGVLLLALVERSLGPRVMAGRLATGDARWIWAGPDWDRKTPRAFFAARDLELDGPPATAEVLVLADEEYVLYVNGERVGSNRYAPGAPLDRYAVADRLRAGTNRLLVELRSARRAGGLLLRLTGAGGLDLVSDESWTILMRHRGNQADPAHPLKESNPPVLWGRPPVGRWRLPEAGAVRPAPGALEARERLRPRRARAEGGDWRRVPMPRPATPSLGRIVTFDWGEPVAGYLVLVFHNRAAARALVYFGDQPPAPREASPAVKALGVRGRLSWSDVVPRRFRYASVVVPGGIKGAYVQPLAPTAEAALMAADEPSVGVFGLDDPPPLIAPIEDEIWRELERVPGVAGGEAG